MKKIILASKSPRRKELLKQIDIDFECIPAVGEEKIERSIAEEIFDECKDTPKGQVRLLAIQKAKEVAGNVKNSIVIGADTVVELEGEILGKPSDSDNAKAMLKNLSGKKHYVHTGVCVLEVDEAGKLIDMTSFSETTTVYVKNISDEEIEKYVATKEPLDKAGAYGIQGRAAAFISKIDGDYNNVVGLPISRLYDELKKYGEIK